MSIKPILFNTDMVRAILDGRKTVTRRLIKPQPTYSPCDGFTWKGAAYGTDFPPTINGAAYNLRCAAPYQPGDIMYVREAYCKNYFDESIAGYRKDMRGNRNAYKADYHKETIGDIVPEPKWTPSIHMPKEAARIFLKVKSVRVERLQDITEEQAKAEGIREYSKDGNIWKYAVTDDWWIEYHHKYRKFFTGSWWQDMPRTAKEAFRHLWNSTLGRRDTPEWYANNWSGNPWVWVIEFERREKPEGW